MLIPSYAVMENRFAPDRLIEDINTMAGNHSIYIDASAITPLSQTMGNAISSWATVGNRGSKEGRIMKMQSDWNNGRIQLFTGNLDKFAHLEAERYDWDFGREYDDALDCVSYAYSEMLS